MTVAATISIAITTTIIIIITVAITIIIITITITITITTTITIEPALERAREELLLWLENKLSRNRLPRILPTDWTRESWSKQSTGTKYKNHRVPWICVLSRLCFTDPPPTRPRAPRAPRALGADPAPPREATAAAATR